MKKSVVKKRQQGAQEAYFIRLKNDIFSNPELYLMIVPVLLFYLIFHYIPMYGVSIAFKDYTPGLGMMGSPWVGIEHFKSFLSDVYFFRILKNTFVISMTSILFGFPAPIILALLINEIKSKYFAKGVQTITYMPHFISLVVICSMIKEFVADNGIITQLATMLGYDGKTMLSKPGLFIPIYVMSGIWQEIGWGSIIYLAALSGVDESLYEAAVIDGAGRWKQMLHVTLPSILPTIVILFIMRMGTVLSVGYEKIILLYNPGIYETSDVISTYVYRKGLQDFAWSYSTAVGLFNSAINVILLILTNNISKKLSGTALW